MVEENRSNADLSLIHEVSGSHHEEEPLYTDRNESPLPQDYFEAKPSGEELFKELFRVPDVPRIDVPRKKSSPKVARPDYHLERANFATSMVQVRDKILVEAVGPQCSI
jgi:hypothetical protein